MQAATHDVVASKDPEFQTYALVRALARISARQQEVIDALKDKGSSAKRSTSSATSQGSTTGPKKNRTGTPFRDTGAMRETVTGLVLAVAEELALRYS